MTPDERTLLTGFLQDLAVARGQAKDAEADALIAQTLRTNPDAAYLLVQHAIVADQSLHAAEGRITQLEQQARQAQPVPPSPSPGFLGAGGSGWGSVPLTAPQDRPSAFSSGGGLGSFLRSAATTAAGVAGGEALFSGVSDLFGGHHGGGFLGGGSGLYGGEPENVTINNYGDVDGDDGSAGFDDGGSNDY